MAKPVKILFALALLVAVAVPFLMSPDQPSGLDLTKEEYAIGSKRQEAVFQKVVPNLKEAFAERNLTWGAPVFLRAFKEEGILEVWIKKGDHFVHFRDYPILADSGKLGPKQAEGDLQVPEGFYYFSRGQMNPASQFHLSFNIGYPNEFDLAHDRTGSFIMVHGSNVSIGCLPIGDDKIEEVFTLVHHAFDNGQKFCRIHLYPFRLTPENLDRHQESPWSPFWENLQEGYQWFESLRIPPNTTVRAKRYHFD
ncbi:MAG: L,D-transpeptidase family protein [Akkermansiaceae bacterium]